MEKYINDFQKLVKNDIYNIQAKIYIALEEKISKANDPFYDSGLMAFNKIGQSNHLELLRKELENNIYCINKLNDIFNLIDKSLMNKDVKNQIIPLINNEIEKAKESFKTLDSTNDHELFNPLLFIDYKLWSREALVKFKKQLYDNFYNSIKEKKEKVLFLKKILIYNFSDHDKIAKDYIALTKTIDILNIPNDNDYIKIKQTLQEALVIKEIEDKLLEKEKQKQLTSKVIIKGFKSGLTLEQVKMLYYKLEGIYIAKNTNIEHFKCIFKPVDLPKDFNLIKWIDLNKKGKPNQTSLREFLRVFMLIPEGKNPTQLNANNYFTDNKGKIIRMSGYKMDECTIDYYNKFIILKAEIQKDTN